MPRYQFPVTSDGLIVPVFVGLGQSTGAALAQAGQPVPPPAIVTGLIDTGSSVTCVSSALIRRFNLPPARTKGYTTTASAANVPVRRYEAGVGIPSTAGVPHPHFWAPQLLVMELPHVIPGIDVLIGMDLLLSARLLIDGPAGTFTLDV